MIGVNTKFGMIYLELTKKDEVDCINIFDSDRKFMYEYRIESNTKYHSPEPFLCAIINRVISMNDIDELLTFLSIDSYTTGNNWIDLLEDMYGLENYEYDLDSDKYVLLSDGSELTQERVLSDFNVNKVGETLVLNCA